MAQAGPEEAALLELLIEERLERERVPFADRSIVRRFEKYAFAIGVDDSGNSFPIPPVSPGEDGGPE